MNRPLRILHAVGKMDRGGIETWLMHLLRRVDRRAVAFDFLVETAQPGAYDEEIRDLGARIIHVERTRRLWEYAPALARALKARGPYDAVHSHVYVFGGLVLGVAASCAVPMRLAHSHMALSPAAPRLDSVRQIYYGALKLALRHSMTHGLAVSKPAAAELFGRGFEKDSRVRVLPCAIDYDAFVRGNRGEAMRRALSIPDDARVLGTVGRLDPEKNQSFLVDAFAAAASKDKKLHLLIVGGGQSRTLLEQQVRDLEVSGRVTFAGVRSDIPAVMAAMDVFALPSKYEGLPLVLMEAQASGLPILVSDMVPSEVFVAGHWARRLSIDGVAVWVEAILEAANLPPSTRRASFDPRFDINNNVRALLAIYGVMPEERPATARAAAG